MNSDNRLEAFERMLAAIQENCTLADSKLLQLESEGKDDTAIYEKLKTSRREYEDMLAMYRLYGLID